MDKYLRPEHLDADPNCSSGPQQWRHWKKTFTSWLATLKDMQEHKLSVLINYVSPEVYEYIAECTTYDSAITTLESLYIRPKNEVFARHMLATRKQEAGETLDQYLLNLQLLSKDCNFKACSAEVARDDSIRDAFINGLMSGHIRQRLLENKTLDLQTAVDKARALETAQKHSESYNQSSYELNEFNAATSLPTERQTYQPQHEQLTAAAASPRYVAPRGTPTSQTTGKRCFFCGQARHPRIQCPAREARCSACGKTGHYSRVCRSSKMTSVAAATSGDPSASSFPTLAATAPAASPGGLSKAILRAEVNGQTVDALVDTGSSQSFVSHNLVKMNKWKLFPSSSKVFMASTAHSQKVMGYCVVTIKLTTHTYSDVKLSVLPDLCADVISGHDVLNEHEAVEIPFGGPRSSLTVCGLATMAVPLPTLFGI